MEKIEKKTGFIPSFDGTPIYYEVRGEGEPVVFIYGIACLMNHWHHQIDAFSRGMMTVAYDLRGHHKSQPVADAGNLTMEALGKDLVALIEHIGAGPAHLIGHSFGAPVILEAYSQRPDLVKSLAFVNGFAKNPIKGMFGVDAVEPFYRFVRAAYEQNPTMWTTLWRMAIENPLSVWLAAAAGGFNLRVTHFKDIEVYARGVAHMDLGIFIKLFEELMNFDGSGILPTIAVPSLIISGENDRVTPKSFQEEFRNRIPNAQFVTVPYGSHCTQLDFPDYVNMKLEKFWNGR